MYDDFFWMNHFGDPGYRYHTLMAQLWGVLALRLANADVLPYDFDSYGENIRQFVVDLNLASHVSGHIDLAALQQRISDFQAAGRELNLAVAQAISSGRLDAAAAARVNQQLMQVERNWCNPAGNSGASLVQTFFVRGALYVCASGIAGIDGSVRGWRLESGGGAGQDSGGRAREEYRAFEADARAGGAAGSGCAMMIFS